MPVPRDLVLKKGSKMLGSVSADMPPPLSVILTITRPFSTLIWI